MAAVSLPPSRVLPFSSLSWSCFLNIIVYRNLVLVRCFAQDIFITELQLAILNNSLSIGPLPISPRFLTAPTWHFPQKHFSATPGSRYAALDTSPSTGQLHIPFCHAPWGVFSAAPSRIWGAFSYDCLLSVISVMISWSWDSICHPHRT